MASFLRRFSSSSTKSDKENNTVVNLVHLDEIRDHQDRIVEEMNANFIHRDAEIYAPIFVKDMKWDGFKERVLHCGCGSGRTGFAHLLPQIYLHDSHLYAMDTSEQLVSYAAMKYPHASVTYTQGDVTSDNFPLKFITFDKIFAIHVLQCVKDYRGALARLFDFLRSGGQLGLTYSTELFTDFLDREFSQDEKWKNYFEDLPEKSEDDASFQLTFHTSLDSVGFEVKKIKTERMEYTFPSLEKAVVYYIGTSPYVKGIPAELRDPFEEDCLEKMTTEFNISQISDPFLATYDCLVVVATKPSDNLLEQKHGKTGKLKSLRSRLSLP